MVYLLILADDFTGALDTGVQFSKQGVKTQVTLDYNVDFSICESDVLVVDTETRHLTKKKAYSIISDLVKRAKKDGVPYIYKKTDSALRGNIGAELAAALESDDYTKQLMFFPAYPQMNRVTVKGIHYIDGVEVTQSPFGKDPFEPVEEANVVKLIEKQTDLFVKSVERRSFAQELSRDKGILVFDAQSIEDLQFMGQSLMQEDKLHLMAGCAGFAELLPDLLQLQRTSLKEIPKLAKEFLVICGSVNPITKAQLEYAHKCGFERIHLTPQQKLEVNYWNSGKGKEELTKLKEDIQQYSCCIVESNDCQECENSITKEYALKRGLDQNTLRHRIGQSLGVVMASVIDTLAERTILITGGDTLLQCMNCVGVSNLEPLHEMEKGVVLAKFFYRGKAQYIITKSGGFGEENLLERLSERIASISNGREVQ